MSISFYLCLLIAYLVYGNDMVYGFPHSRFSFFAPGYMGYRPQQNVTDDVTFFAGWPEAETTVHAGDNVRDEREDKQQISLDKSFIDFFVGGTEVAHLSETSSSAEMVTNADLLKDLRRLLSGQHNLIATVDNANLSLIAGNERFTNPSYQKAMLHRHEVVPHGSLGPLFRLRPPYGVNKHKKARHFLNSNAVPPFHSVSGNGGEELTILEYEPSQSKLVGGTYLYPGLTKSPAIMINWLNETPIIKPVELGFQGPDQLLNRYQFTISFPYQLKYQNIEGNIVSETSSSLFPSSSQNPTINFTVPTSHILPATSKPVQNATFIPFFAAPQFWGSLNNHSFKSEDSHGMSELPKFLGFPFSILPIQIEAAVVTELQSTTVSLSKTTKTVSTTPEVTLGSPIVLQLNEVPILSTDQRNNMQYVNLSNQNATLKFGNVLVNGFSGNQTFFERSSPASLALLLQGNTSILIQVLQPPLPMALTTHRAGVMTGTPRSTSGLPSHYSLHQALQFDTQTTSSETETFERTTAVTNEHHLTVDTPNPISLCTQCQSNFRTCYCTPKLSTCTTKRHKTKATHKTSKKCTTTLSCITPTTKTSSTTMKCTTSPTACSATKLSTVTWCSRTMMGTHNTTILSGSDLLGHMQFTLAPLSKTTTSNMLTVNGKRMESSMRDMVHRIICGNIGPTMKITEVTTSREDHVSPSSFSQVNYEAFTKTADVNPLTLRIKLITDSHTFSTETTTDINKYYEKLVLDMIHQLETTADKGMNFMNNSALLIIPDEKQTFMSSSNPSLNHQPLRNCMFPRPTTSPYMPYLEEDENWNYITF